MSPKDGWGSFNTTGSAAGFKRSTLSDYMWLLIGAVIGGALIGGGGYVALIFLSYRRRYAAAGLDELHQGVTFEMFSHTMMVCAIVGAVVGFFAGLAYCRGCMAEENEAEQAAVRRATTVHPMFDKPGRPDSE